MDKREFPSFERREEVPERYRWDTTRLFENDEAFSRALSEAKDLEEEYEIWEPTAMSSGAGASRLPALRRRRHARARAPL